MRATVLKVLRPRLGTAGVTLLPLDAHPEGLKLRTWVHPPRFEENLMKDK